MAKERNISLDIIRIVAVLAVIMIHVSTLFVGAEDATAQEFFWGNIFNSISRFGAPLFLMVSGALMLDEKRVIRIKTLISKNIKNIVFLLLFWSVFYACIYSIAIPILEGTPLNYKDIINAILLGHYHMWFLHMIIGIYFITPFLREFVKKENKQLLNLFFAVAVITQFSQPIIKGLSLIVEDVSILLTFIEQFHFDFFGTYVTYYILGWYLTNIDIKKKGLLYCCGIISLLLTIVYVQITKDSSLAYVNSNVFILLYSAAVFLALNSFGTKYVPGIKIKKIIEVSSKLSFGVYITHVVVLSVFNKVFQFIQNPVLFILICFCSITCVSFAGCFLASKIPFVKKLIRA